MGDIIDGTVTRVAESGLFVEDAEGNDYFLALHELWWDRRGVASEFADVGDMVRFKVIKMDRARGTRLGSPKQAFPERNPWRDPAKLSVGTRFEGYVCQLASYGAFVKHPLGLDALLHVSLMPNDRDLKVGDRVDVIITKSDADSRLVSVRLADET